MAAVGSLTPTPIPSGDTIGGEPIVLYHLRVTTGTTGAGTYLIPHGLPYTPSVAFVVKIQAEVQVAPTATTALVSFCAAKTDGTNVAINVPATTAITYDVYYG